MLDATKLEQMSEEDIIKVYDGTYESVAGLNDRRVLVIEDGIAYWIGEDFEIIKEIGSAKSVANYGDIFKVTYEDDSFGFVTV